MKRSLKLTIELVPSPLWDLSLFDRLRDSERMGEWAKLKEGLSARDGGRCWICGNSSGTFEAHELWEYNYGRVQKLVAVHLLCGLCHKVKHIGYWCHTPEGMERLRKSGLERDDLIDHFCKVNGCTRLEFKWHEDEAFETWKKRSERKWVQDLGEYASLIDVEPVRK